jgi:hypothetical protein
MRHNALAQILDRRMEERRHEERSGQIDRRMKIPHYRDAEIRRAVSALNLGD